MNTHFEPALCYHIYHHANGFENIFREEKKYHYFLRKYTEYISPIAHTYAYCLMPNHYHFLARLKSEDELRIVLFDRKINETELGMSTLISKQFSNFLNGYAKAFNNMYNRRGSLFTQNMKRKLINSDEYYTKVIGYIHTNPVKHKFVKRIEDWSHSSYHHLISDAETFIKRDEVLKWFGGREGFIKFHKDLQ